ncbi:MAG: hypothetical protein O7J95_11930, partial [Planctomycetota bacterium]|nr:hypothetical protein [Planctomycetota bacterium]
MRSRGSRTSEWGFVLGVSLIVCLSTSGGLVAQTSIDFDANGPTMTSELSNFFDFLGADTASWQVDPNLQDPGNDTQALHTTSDDGQLADYFSRVAILKAEVFEAADVDFTVSITWDDAGGDANDHAGAYVRFNGESGVPTENDYYFVRIDAGGDSSSVTLHKVKDGVHEPLISAQDEPFVIREGDTVTLNVRAAGNEIFVS